jgi:hypothetical protein
MMFLERMVQRIQTYNQKIHTYPEISEKLNFKNYTKWYKEIQTEIDDRWLLNHIIVAPPENQDPQWKLDDAQVMLWIVYTLNTTISDAAIYYTCSAHELWTWIFTLIGPITDESESEKGEENRSESENSSFRQSDEFKNEKVVSKAPVDHWNGGKTNFAILHQENQQTSILNPNPLSLEVNNKMQNSTPNPENGDQHHTKKSKFLCHKHHNNNSQKSKQKKNPQTPYPNLRFPIQFFHPFATLIFFIQPI